jgi:ABC-2 type transport system permease protein
VKLITEKINEKGERFETFSMINMFVGLILSIFVYLFIFLYGTQVMRGVLEEKTNRIVEIIISSVKPIELMMGKITGIALVALTQFVIWIIAVLILYSAAMSLFLYKYDNALKTEQLQKEILIEKGPITGKNLQSLPKDVDKDFYYMYKSFKNIDFTAILFSFAFYFLFGYLMYAALYAAIGAAVDNDADSQQFLVPVSVPLILGYVISSSIFENPEGTVAFWFSIIPLTSPIVMMIRLPFGVPMWELLLSMVLVVVGFVFFTWLAAKIYRTGILLYGQKVTWKDLFLWIKAGK